MTTRRANAKAILLAPFKLLLVLLAMAWMVVTLPVLWVIAVVTLGPAALLWAISPFVGVISPSAGHKLASYVESGADTLDAAMDFLWKPVDRLFG